MIPDPNNPNLMIFATYWEFLQCFEWGKVKVKEESEK